MQSKPKVLQASAARVATLCLVALLVSSVAVPAVAAPNTYVSSASVDKSVVLVGENVTVTAVVKNLGDSGGGHTVSFKQNGSEFARERVQVASGGTERANVSVQLEQTGVYKFGADKKETRTVRVVRAFAETKSTTNESRTVTVRAGEGPETGPYEIQFPAATDRPFAVEHWTVEGEDDSFTQAVTEYTRPEAATVDLPDSETATVVGVLTVDSTTTTESATMRLRVNRSTLRAVDLATDEVTVYHRNETASSWEPLETTVAEERTDSVVYEVTATEFSTFAVGSIEPQFSIDGTALSTAEDSDGQRLVLEGTISNDGAIEGEYTARMFVNDESVEETTVTIPAGEKRRVELSHVVTESGTYEIGLNDRDAGSIVLSESDVSTGGDSTESGSGAGTDAEMSTPGGGEESGLLPAGVPATVMGISTLYLAAGVAVALVVFFGIVGLLLRRGGGGGSGGGGGFEQL